MSQIAEDHMKNVDKILNSAQLRYLILDYFSIILPIPSTISSGFFQIG